MPPNQGGIFYAARAANLNEKKADKLHEGKTLPIDFKQAIFLRDQAKKDIERSDHVGLYGSGATGRQAVWQNLASMLCPGHVWKNEPCTGRTCKVCGGYEEDGSELLDEWLEFALVRGCYNCANCTTSLETLLAIRADKEVVSICSAKEHSNLDEATNKEVLAAARGEINCPHWDGKL